MAGITIRLDGLDAHIQQVVAEAVEAALGAREANPWLDSAAAASYLGVARSPVHDLVSDGKLPRVGGRKTRLVFRRSTLDAYLASRGQS